VLDLAMVSGGATSAEALADATAVARRADELGYHRFWVAEHHNMPGIASSSPPVLLAHLAAASSTIRVGSGGVMLPNHAPLVVAEQFGTLDALHPGRIDLGIGRAPGTDPRTARALRRGTDPLGADDFPEQLGELLSYFRGEGPVVAVPAQGQHPAVWLLGSSGYSAQVAGLLGLPFAFAHHFSSQNTMPALELYRRTFRPSDVLDEPRPCSPRRTTTRRAAWPCRRRCSSCSCAWAGRVRCRPRRTPPRTPTPPRSAGSSRSGSRGRSSDRRRRCGPA
jgi:luciferase family oxidoreductase group 1